MLESNFWQDKIKSKNIIKEKKLYEDLINSHENSLNKLKDLDDLYKLAIEENNQSIQDEIFENIKDLKNFVKKTKLNVFYLKKAILLIATLKFMQVLGELKVRIGQIC